LKRSHRPAALSTLSPLLLLRRLHRILAALLRCTALHPDMRCCCCP
jgi:hypothetical protein